MASTSTERVRRHRERKKWLELQIAGKPTPLPKLPPPGQEWKAIYEWSKTLVAIILLAYLAGPLRRRGFRGIVCSLTGRLAQELWHAMQGIANASQLGGLQFKRTPQPGIVIEGCREGGNFNAVH